MATIASLREKLADPNTQRDVELKLDLTAQLAITLARSGRDKDIPEAFQLANSVWDSTREALEAQTVSRRFTVAVRQALPFHMVRLAKAHNDHTQLNVWMSRVSNTEYAPENMKTMTNHSTRQQQSQPGSPPSTAGTYRLPVLDDADDRLNPFEDDEFNPAHSTSNSTRSRVSTASSAAEQERPHDSSAGDTDRGGEQFKDGRYEAAGRTMGQTRRKGETRMAQFRREWEGEGHLYGELVFGPFNTGKRY